MSRDKDVLNDLEQEIEYHIEQEIQENIEHGLTPIEARRQAMLKFGNALISKEDTRAVWIWIWFEQLLQDLRYAFRMILRNPGFASLVILTLALGIGANTAVFSLMDQVLLRDLPVARPEELVLLDGPGAFQGSTKIKQGFSFPMFQGLKKAAAPVLSGMFARYATSATVNIGNDPERVIVELVSGDYFSTLGIRAVLGRTLGPEDERLPGAHPVIVLSYDYWQRRFGGERSVMNQTIRVNNHPMTVIGVAEQGFIGVDIGQPADFFLPIMMKKELTPTWNDLDNWRSRWVNIMGRLKSGISLDKAAAVLNVNYRQLLAEDLKTVRASEATPVFSAQFLGKKLHVLSGESGRSSLKSQFHTPLIVLMGLVAFVLLIACANVANLLIARAITQQREIVIRLALGAGQFRLIQQRLVESLVLWAGATAIGLLFAWWTISLLLKILPYDRGVRALASYPDLRVILFAIVISVVTALVFGLAPILSSRKTEMVQALNEHTTRTTGGRRQLRLRKILLTAQIGLSLVLLTGAGLFSRSLFNLQNHKPGFIADKLLQFSVDPSLNGYNRERSIELFRIMQHQLSELHGVTVVSIAAVPAMNDSNRRRTVRVMGYVPPSDENVSPSVNAVGPGYFAAMGIPVLNGRDFLVNDIEDVRRVAIVNQRMAKFFWPEENPIGKRLGWANGTGSEIEVIGVVGDSNFSNIRDEIPCFIYIPYVQEDILNRMTFYVRHQQASADLPIAVRQVVQRLDPNLPIFELNSMKTQIDETIFRERLMSVLSVLFAVLATTLAGVGLYGVTSYMVSQRTTEIGIRMALGAQRSLVLWLVLREIIALMVVGVLSGIAIALALCHLVQSQLFGLSSIDPISLIAATTSLVIAAMLAAYIPARRATHLDPMIALRHG